MKLTESAAATLDNRSKVFAQTSPGVLVPVAAPVAGRAPLPPMLIAKAIGVAAGVERGVDRLQRLAGYDWGGVFAPRERFVYVGGFVGAWLQRETTPGVGWSWAPYPDGPGPHNFPTDDLVSAHLAKIPADLARAGVGPDYRGTICIDYEGAFCWSQATAQQKLAWTKYVSGDGVGANPAYVRRIQGDPKALEAFLRNSWNARTKDIIIRTLNAVWSYARGATRGFYAQPPQDLWPWYAYAPDMDGGRSLQETHDTELGWLWSRVDAFFPSIYPFFRADTPGERTQFSDPCTPDLNLRYAAMNVLEAQRLELKFRPANADRRPVYPWAWWRYHPNGQTKPRGYITEASIRETFYLPKALGADGLVLYEWWDTLDELEEGIATFERRFLPVLREIAGGVAQPSAYHQR